MRLHTVRETFTKGQTFTLWPLGDIHLGSANCDKGALTETINAIRQDKNARWIGMGDYVEWITPSDKRWAAGGIDEQIVNMANLDRIGDVYVEKISTLLRPIMKQCWAFGKGNHEEHYEQAHDTSLIRRILYETGSPDSLYSGWACITRVCFESAHNERSSVRIFHSHGWQAGRLSGAKVNQLDHLMGWIGGCRIYLQGHSHDKLVKSKTRLDTDPHFTKLTATDSYGAHTGSFLRTYQKNVTGYGEAKGYPPTSIGCVQFKLTPSRSGVEIASVQ